jgi:hypothetical protein
LLISFTDLSWYFGNEKKREKKKNNRRKQEGGKHSVDTQQLDDDDDFMAADYVYGFVQYVMTFANGDRP